MLEAKETEELEVDQEAKLEYEWALELEREGVLVTRHGIGSIIAEDADLGVKMYRQELDKHLEEAAKLAALIGLSSEELQERIRAACDQVIKERS